MTWQLDVIESPGWYQERELQAVLEDLWPWLFPQYRLIEPASVREIDNWFPDIVAMSADEGFIIGEVKRSGGRPAALEQLSGYVSRFHETWPENRVRPIVFGPWEQEALILIVESGGYAMGILEVQQLGQRIRNAAISAMTAYGEELRRITDFDWTRLTPQCQVPIILELFLWLLRCPIRLKDDDIAQTLVVDLSILKPQLASG